MLLTATLLVLLAAETQSVKCNGELSIIVTEPMLHVYNFLYPNQ